MIKVIYTIRNTCKDNPESGECEVSRRIVGSTKDDIELTAALAISVLGELIDDEEVQNLISKYMEERIQKLYDQLFGSAATIQ
jgi:chaperonin GroEL (HSP60 family)